MNGQGIVDSGEAVTAGSGAMSQRRIQDFYNQLIKAGQYKPGEVDLLKVATLQFVNKRTPGPDGAADQEPMTGTSALRRSDTRSGHVWIGHTRPMTDISNPAQ